MWRELGKLALVLGGIYLATAVTVPAAFGAAAYGVYRHAEGKGHGEGRRSVVVWGLAAAGLLTAVLLADGYVSAVKTCRAVDEDRRLVDFPVMGDPVAPAPDATERERRLFEIFKNLDDRARARGEKAQRVWVSKKCDSLLFTGPQPVVHARR